MGQKRQLKKMLEKFLENKSSVAGSIILLLFIFTAVFSDHLVLHDPNETNVALQLLGPSSEYPLGTDPMGRCILSRLIAGTPATLGNAVLVLIGMLLIGVPLGIIAGNYGGLVDTIIMRAVDIVCTFPSSMVALAVVSILGPGTLNIMLVLVSLWWAPLARMVRGEVLQIKEKEYVLAAKAAGSSNLQIMIHHILPNIISPVIVYATLRVGAIIMHIAGFSFIGLGTQPPYADWGVMLSDSRDYISIAPALMVWPGLAIMLVVFSLNLAGEGMSQAIRPYAGNISRKESD